MARDRRPSVFSSTHRRLGDHHQNGRSMRDLQDRASFDQAPAPGCLLITFCTIVAAVMGVIFCA